jgi:hypothetical protein
LACILRTRFQKFWFGFDWFFLIWISS